MTLSNSTQRRRFFAQIAKGLGLATYLALGPHQAKITQILSCFQFQGPLPFLKGNVMQQNCDGFFFEPYETQYK